MSNPLALVIEDDDDAAAIFAEAMREAQFDVEVIKSGDLAASRLAQVVPHTIVLDLHLPHVSGMMLLRQIQSDARLVNVHVIVATADSQRADELREEVDLALVKPISFGQLRDLAIRLNPKPSAS